MTATRSKSLSRPRKINETFVVIEKSKWYFVTKIVLTYCEKNCFSDLKNFANSRPTSSNFQSFSQSLEQFFLTVGQNNFGNKIPFFKINNLPDKSYFWMTRFCSLPPHLDKSSLANILKTNKQNN